MNGNRIMEQFKALFSLFMVAFYFGVGIYFIFFMKMSTLDRAVIVIMGSTFIFYGIYRAYRSVVDIKKAFFSRDRDDD